MAQETKLEPGHSTAIHTQLLHIYTDGGGGGVSLAQIWTHTHTTDQKGASGSPIQIPLKSLKAEV